MVNKLKRRLGITGTETDELLADLLEYAGLYIMGYTGRASVPDVLHGVQVELAAAAYNRLGTEGESARSEGGVSVTLDGLPEASRRLLNRCRVAKVGF